jgi:segregation and condensation protein B
MSEVAENFVDEIEDDVAIEEMVVAEEQSVIPLDDPQQQKRLIEALLFASPEPIKLRAIQSRLPDTADVGFLLLELQKEYSMRGVQLVQLEDSWAFRTASDIGAQLAINKREEKKLSRAALETLAIIAYHQPVTRAEVENIRGVATNKGTLDVLMEAGWIKPGKRLETPGRPVSWLTTTAFLDEFGISNLNDLPGLAELKASGLLDTRPAIDTIPGARDLFSAENTANENNPEIGEDGLTEQTGEFDQVVTEISYEDIEIQDEDDCDDEHDDSDDDDLDDEEEELN